MDKEIKILVISDSHRKTNLVEEVVKKEMPFDLMIHCGDAQDSLAQFSEENTGAPLLAVRGNCDYDAALPKKIVRDVGEHRVFVTHGHMYGVNWGLHEILREAGGDGADIICFGHTHLPGYETDTRTGIFMLNPGSIAEPRQSGWQRTYAVLTLSADGSIHAKLKTL